MFALHLHSFLFFIGTFILVLPDGFGHRRRRRCERWTGVGSFASDTLKCSALCTTCCAEARSISRAGRRTVAKFVAINVAHAVLIALGILVVTPLRWPCFDFAVDLPRTRALQSCRVAVPHPSIATEHRNRKRDIHDHYSAPDFRRSVQSRPEEPRLDSRQGEGVGGNEEDRSERTAAGAAGARHVPPDAPGAGRYRPVAQLRPARGSRTAEVREQRDHVRRAQGAHREVDCVPRHHHAGENRRAPKTRRSTCRSVRRRCR